MKHKTHKTIKSIIVIFFIIGTIMLIVTFMYGNNLKKLQKAEQKKAAQIVTESTQSKSDKNIVKNYKNSINKLENDINEKTEENPLLEKLKIIINDIINALTFNNLKDKGIINVQNELNSFMTDTCLKNTIKNLELNGISEENESYQKFLIKNFWIDTKDINAPKVICLSNYENDNLSETKYLDFDFIYNKDKNTYTVSNFKIAE